jgi:hypothetical protein
MALVKKCLSRESVAEEEGTVCEPNFGHPYGKTNFQRTSCDAMIAIALLDSPTDVLCRTEKLRLVSLAVLEQQIFQRKQAFGGFSAK